MCDEFVRVNPQTYLNHTVATATVYKIHCDVKISCKKNTD